MDHWNVNKTENILITHFGMEPSQLMRSTQFSYGPALWLAENAWQPITSHYDGKKNRCFSCRTFLEIESQNFESKSLNHQSVEPNVFITAKFFAIKCSLRINQQPSGRELPLAGLRLSDLLQVDRTPQSARLRPVDNLQRTHTRWEQRVDRREIVTLTKSASWWNTAKNITVDLTKNKIKNACISGNCNEK